ncbi:MAG: metallophosphoesterase [Syntrophobacterales bacterium]|nr:metallophosphoesterase [Syntrophobacterales bacterium]
MCGPATGWRRRWRWAALLVALAVAWAAPLGFRAHAEELPARDFNLLNLQRLAGVTHNPLTFVVLGDSRDHGGLFPLLLQEVAREEGVSLVIHLGDLVNRSRLWEYRQFFRDLKALSGLPLLTVPGNHELKGEASLFGEIFGPADLSFSLGDYAFVLINNAKPAGLSPARRQWLAAELSRHRDARLRLVFLHVPLFDPRPGRSKPHALPAGAARELLTVLKEGRADHVFAGHIHGYFTGEWEGLPYTISGGAGTALHGRNPRHYFHHYLKVTARGGRLEVSVKPVDFPVPPHVHEP